MELTQETVEAMEAAAWVCSYCIEGLPPPKLPVALTPLSYRMIYAVASAKTVFLYDTETPAPFLIAGDLHHATITDMAWEADGNRLCVSSAEGFVSFLTFTETTLGQPLASDELTALRDRISEARRKVQEGSQGKNKSKEQKEKERQERKELKERERAARLAAAEAVAEDKRKLPTTTMSPGQLTAAVAPIASLSAPVASLPVAKRRIVPALVSDAGGSPLTTVLPSIASTDTIGLSDTTETLPMAGQKRRRIVPTLVSSEKSQESFNAPTTATAPAEPLTSGSGVSKPKKKRRIVPTLVPDTPPMQ